MSASTNRLIEVLPPERESDGRFKPGHAGGPGRPAAQPIGFTKKMRDAISEAFDQVGGVDYLVMLAFWKPELFTALVGRALPIKVVGDEESPAIHVVARVERKFIDPD